jgi:putative membrane protein
MEALATYVSPWEFSPTVLLACASAAVAYARGLSVLRRRRESVSAGRSCAFFFGLGLTYAVLQTYVDFLAQHMFWVHRLQHLILHHIAPVLMVISAPGHVIRQGLPRALPEMGLRMYRYLGWPLRFAQHPIVAPVMFVGLIYFWLTPSVHFDAMLDDDRYRIMNWSMAVDGILFWWLMLRQREQQGSVAIGYGTRLLILCVVALLQILLGAYITLHRAVLFDIYDLCGRAWTLSPLADQELGGLLTWIPAAMMSGVGLLVVLRHALHESRPMGAAAQSAATTPIS